MSNDGRSPKGRGAGSLRVVQEAVTLSRRTHELTPRARSRSDDLLRDQLRRASVSVYANIVEGHARASRRESLRFITIAWSSLREYEAHLEIATVADLVPESGAAELRRRARWVGRLLAGLRRYYQAG